MVLQKHGLQTVVNGTSKMKSFTAKCVTCQNENGVVMVGFANDEFETTEYLLFQRTLEPDAQDCELGQDKIHVQLDSPDHSGYGGVQTIQLRDSTLRVEVDGTMAQVLGNSVIEIELKAKNVDRASLKEHLSLVVGDEPILQVQ